MSRVARRMMAADASREPSVPRQHSSDSDAERPSTGTSMPKGTITYADGSKYEGSIVEGRRQGQGAMLYPDGSRYEGGWVSDARHGHGTFNCADDKSEYKGYWREGKRSGTGAQVYGDGSRYDGGWLADARDGWGVFSYADGSRYEGTWKDDARHGRGTFLWADGGSYSGEWAFGKMHGQGVRKYADGSSYTGGFVAGSKHGRGAMRWRDGSTYDGEWKDDRRHGRGRMVWVDEGRAGRDKGGDAARMPGTYEGDWVDGLMEGEGRRVYADGRTYAGAFYRGRKHGKGEMRFPGGWRYVGEWAEDRMEGEGVHNWPNGHSYSGGTNAVPCVGCYSLACFHDGAVRDIRVRVERHVYRTFMESGRPGVPYPEFVRAIKTQLALSSFVVTYDHDGQKLLIADQGALDSFLEGRLAASWLFVKRASQRIKCVYVPDARTLASIASNTAILPSPYGHGAPVGLVPGQVGNTASPASGVVALSTPVQFLSPPFGPFLLSAATASAAVDAVAQARNNDAVGGTLATTRGTALNNTAPSAAVNNAAAATAAHAASPFVVGKVDVAFPVTFDGLVAALRSAGAREEAPVIKYIDRDNDMVDIGDQADVDDWGLLDFPKIFVTFPPPRPIAPQPVAPPTSEQRLCVLRIPPDELGRRQEAERAKVPPLRPFFVQG